MTAELQILLDLNSFIQQNSERFDYHMKHITLVRKYALALVNKVDTSISKRKISYAALCHDLFKERGLNEEKEGTVQWKDHPIPQDLNKYVRTNLHVLEEFNLDLYFNTDIQLHALAAGIWVYNELGIKDPEILYPIFFHSCPIIEVYESLPIKIRNSCDILMLADKLSSNYLRINMMGTEVRVDLDKAVFGTTGIEFNYSLGLFLARLISQGKSTETQSNLATEYFYKRLSEQNPIISKNYSIKKLGGNTVWPKRSSRVWRQRLTTSKK